MFQLIDDLTDLLLKPKTIEPAGQFFQCKDNGLDVVGL